MPLPWATRTTLPEPLRDLRFSLWIVRNNRPLTIGEHDRELRDIFEYIFQADDIWSEGGIAIFGILAYWITKSFEYKEKLLSAIPFGDVRHNALELELATKRACADFGIGSFEEGEDKSITIDTVTDSVHATISDSASNIIKGWISFDGYECSCHLLALSTTEYLESDGVKEVFGKMRGMTTHFNHSVIGRNLLHDCQKKYNLPATAPPQDNATRGAWKGSAQQSSWYAQQQEAVQLYDVEQPNAVDNPDGSPYKDHKLQLFEWDVARESSYILAMTAMDIDILQSTKTATSSLVLPVVGRLTYNLKADTPMKHNGNFVQITSLEVQEARELLRKDIIRRFYTELSECKLEDFAVATFVDPRYKALDFRGLEEWQRGELTAHQVIEWARQAYDADWKPKAATSQPVDAPQVSAPRLKVSNLVSFLDEEEDDEAAIVQEEVEFVGRESEFTLYLSMPPAEKSLDPLHWWGDREEKLPNLSRMARQFLAPPASTAGVERMFSACGQLHSDLKNKCLRDDPATLHDGIH
ncbi:hypothetical protein CYMTET_16029 [Cymbomonas tetramitiformis]|uniref:HAT C-terminal dimerisation domain-containing protein n=1 Tax=Cymbomonas tetramitiformis TaxID=36881 RepID=A0AAE0GCX2_9CHLO|nr:hypothetical protein CYMTET_16029 [Cymbomonas tetramitiformis]